MDLLFAAPTPVSIILIITAWGNCRFQCHRHVMFCLREQPALDPPLLPVDIHRVLLSMTFQEHGCSLADYRCHSGFGTPRKHSKGSRPNGRSCWEIILSAPKLGSQPLQQTRTSASPPFNMHETVLETSGKHVHVLAQVERRVLNSNTMSTYYFVCDKVPRLQR